MLFIYFFESEHVVHHNKSIITSVIVVLLTVGAVSAQEKSDTRALVQEALDRATSMETSIHLPEQKNYEGTQAAEKANEYIKSKQFNQQLEAEKDRIHQQFFSGYTKDIFEHNKVPENNDISEIDILSSNERVYVLVSSSIPKDTLRAYVQSVNQLQDHNVIIAFRGFIGGVKNYQPTVDYIESLLKQDTQCQNTINSQCEYYQASFNIDPLVFRKFQVNQVPAVVYVDNVQMQDPGKSIGLDKNLKAPVTSHIIYGDSTLKYALERLGKLTGQGKLTAMAEKIDRGFHGEN